jgi:hypothetical protein
MTPTKAPTPTATPTKPAGSAYKICPLFDQGYGVKSGATFAVQVRVCDAYGRNLSSSKIQVTGLYLIDPATGLHRAISAPFNWRNVFYYSPWYRSYWLYENTRGLHAGTWTMVVKISGDPNLHTIKFRVR